MVLAAAILTIEPSRCATILDVSSTGARLGGCGEVQPGEDLWIRVGVIDTLASIAWCEGGQCGVHFDAPLSEEDVAHLRSEARNTLVTRLTPEERLAALDWMSGLRR